MAVLETLPDELLEQILEDLRQRDLANISLVSRRLRNISQPLLYREPHLAITDQCPTTFDLFFGTLLTLASESLGRHARSLTIDWNSGHIRDELRDLPILVPILAAARAHFNLGDTRISEIRQVVLLLQLMPRLQALHLPHLHHEVRSAITSHRQHLETLPPTLRDFTYEWPAPRKLLHLENLLTILGLPRIRSIVVDSISQSSFTDAENSLIAAAAGTSSLTQLTIRSGRTEPAVLQKIFSIPRALTDFVYHPYRMSDFAAFGRALRPLQHSLTSVLLDFRLNGPQWLRRRPTATIGSLHDWAALQSVACTLRVLVGTDSYWLAAVLPAGIRHLEILDDGDVPVGEAVKEVVAMLEVADMVPGLERVRVYAGRRKSKKLRKRLRKACWKVGVAFEDGLIFEQAGWVM